MHKINCTFKFLLSMTLLYIITNFWSFPKKKRPRAQNVTCNFNSHISKCDIWSLLNTQTRYRAVNHPNRTKPHLESLIALLDHLLHGAAWTNNLLQPFSQVKTYRQDLTKQFLELRERAVPFPQFPDFVSWWSTLDQLLYPDICFTSSFRLALG